MLTTLITNLETMLIFIAAFGLAYALNCLAGVWVNIGVNKASWDWNYFRDGLLRAGVIVGVSTGLVVFVSLFGAALQAVGFAEVETANFLSMSTIAITYSVGISKYLKATVAKFYSIVTGESASDAILDDAEPPEI